MIKFPWFAFSGHGLEKTSDMVLSCLDSIGRPTLTDGYSLRCGNFTDAHRGGRRYGLSCQSTVAYPVSAMHQVRILR